MSITGEISEEFKSKLRSYKRIYDRERGIPAIKSYLFHNSLSFVWARGRHRAIVDRAFRACEIPCVRVELRETGPNAPSSNNEGIGYVVYSHQVEIARGIINNFVEVGALDDTELEEAPLIIEELR